MGREATKKKKMNKIAKSGGFESLGLNPNVFKGIKRKGYKVPTPIQRKTMPLILSGSDVVAMARTGSGKTAAFLVPMLHRLNQHIPQSGVRALILSPTRDLALQTLKFTKELGHFTDLRVSLLVGGDSMESQFEELAQSPDIIIATPGRLMHHLSEVDDMSLRSVEYVVFDEADCLFGMGFAEQLHQILAQLGESRQTLLFSATLPSALAEFAKAGLRDPQLVRLDLETRISPDLKLAFFTLRQEEKYSALLYLIREHIGSDQQTLIFVSTKHHVEFLNLLFREEGIVPSVCYGDMDQDARKIHVSRFRARKTMLLIVTDVAARGIDIPLLDNVINWDFPPKPKIFVHRVGRAARAGRTGTAYSFVTPEDMAYLLDLHLFLSKPIKPAPTEEEFLQDMDGVMSRCEQAMANRETIYGRFPQKVIDLVSDRVREIIDTSAELELLQRTCKNAFRLYSKTKPLPAKESIRRVKDLPHEGLHPMFMNVLETGELTALAFSEHLKKFRPKQTILEAEGEAAKSKHQQGPSGQWVDVMKRKRAIHENIINLVREQQQSKSNKEKEEIQSEISPSMEKGRKARGSKRKPQSFKDEDHYISSIPKNQHMEAGLTVKANEDFASNSFWYGEDRPRWLGPISYEYPSYLTGELPGDYGFDIAGLGQDPVALQKYFNFEILHARWAMLASVGALIPEILDLLGAFHFVEPVWWRVGYSKLKGDTLDYLGIQGLHFAGSQGVVVIAICQALLMVGPEYARYCGIEALEPLGIYLPGDINYPGGVLFDPLNLSNDPEAFEELKVKEIKNGRLAMVAWLGFYVQAALTGKGPVQNLIDHISDPFHNNLLGSLNFIKVVM